MVFSKATLVALAMSLFSVNAHMVISNPVPYGQSSLNNSPLENSGSDFPCKQRPGVYDITKMNNMPVGVPQKLTFMGGATHGGGSCQVSVTLDQKPTKNSQWKVVKSIIGGCPASVNGNLGSDAQGTDASQFEFTLPKGMPNGQYTLAWTWFNKIGNREMYMNCAPIEVTGGSSDNTVFNSLPDMFVANLPREECQTPSDTNLIFPEPGNDVQTVIAASPGTVSGSNCAAQTKLGAGAGNAGTPVQPTSGPSSSAPASSPSVSSKAGGEFAPLPSSSAARPTATSLATVTLTRSAPASSRTGTAPPPPANTAPAGKCGVGAAPCTGEGMYCFSTTKWGLCENGCAAERFVSPKTECRNNSIQHVSAGKRDFLRRHAHRRHFQNSI
ncbi:hypothetical protein W97_02275 [Coniosporium apollinis CBS 100218]|uniref:Chitin-binding type-4 domain-containing protein n=1 Tax=Coniosporium apollinis (strain CBS 100218) TaxID=1168221 RepID=R7YMF3_CONA1|nr:uncharacterized protein W97_02275 [Coniosporium apollinis CBS 100218]EON63048.1 hypothetical protein W97_02275 [Coniosporium apollinis CBS 100218]